MAGDQFSVLCTRILLLRVLYWNERTQFALNTVYIEYWPAVPKLLMWKTDSDQSIMNCLISYTLLHTSQKCSINNSKILQKLEQHQWNHSKVSFQWWFYPRFYKSCWKKLSIAVCNFERANCFGTKTPFQTSFFFFNRKNCLNLWTCRNS